MESLEDQLEELKDENTELQGKFCENDHPQKILKWFDKENLIKEENEQLANGFECSVCYNTFVTVQV